MAPAPAGPAAPAPGAPGAVEAAALAAAADANAVARAARELAAAIAPVVIVLGDPLETARNVNDYVENYNQHNDPTITEEQAVSLYEHLTWEYKFFNTNDFERLKELYIEYKNGVNIIVRKYMGNTFNPNTREFVMESKRNVAKKICNAHRKKDRCITNMKGGNILKKTKNKYKTRGKKTFKNSKRKIKSKNSKTKNKRKNSKTKNKRKRKY